MYRDLGAVERRLDWLENHGVAADVAHANDQWWIIPLAPAPRRPHRPSYLGPALVLLVMVAAFAAASL